jgi:uncharacterized membrane protein YqjE
MPERSAALRRWVFVASLPTIAMVLAVGGGFIAWVGLQVARDNWVRWVLLGSLGMTFVTVVALVAAEIVTVAMFVPAYRWAQPDNVSLMIGDIVFLLPISLPVGFLLGFGFFGAAGWLWARRLASRSPDRC